MILTHFLHDSDDLDGEETFVWEFESLVEMEEMFSIWETEDLKKMKAKLTNILEATAEFSQSGNASSQAYKEQEEDDWMNQHYGD